jgi:hypothetical protein
MMAAFKASGLCTDMARQLLAVAVVQHLLQLLTAGSGPTRKPALAAGGVRCLGSTCRRSGDGGATDRIAGWRRVEFEGRNHGISG